MWDLEREGVGLSVEIGDGEPGEESKKSKTHTDAR